MEELLKKLHDMGLTLTPTFNAGVIRHGSQWFSGKQLTFGEHTVSLAWFGDFKKDSRGEWRGGTDQLSAGDRKKLEEEVELILAAEQAAREEHWEIVAKEAEAMWADGTNLGTHPYLQSKKLTGMHGSQLVIHEKGHPILLVPMRDLQGKLWNVTRIYSKIFEDDKGGKRGNKFVLKGGRKLGVMHILGEICEASTVYICEGFSTGAAVYESLVNQPVVVAFDAGNLDPVAKALRNKFPSAKFVFCADNDQWTKRSNGMPWNPGREKAVAAASCYGGIVVLPRFTESQLLSKPTDFCDVFCLMGPSEVADQITNPSKSLQEVIPLLPQGKGAKARVTEKDVCTALLDYFSHNVIAYEQDLFIYGNGYWRLLSFNERNKIKQRIGGLAPGYGSRDIDGAFKYFLTFCPTPPHGVNMFQPTPFAANFQNGTLHVLRGAGGRYGAEFKPHSREDYLTSVLPFDFPGIPNTPEYKNETNPEFDGMLERVWQGDEDIADKIKLYKQLLGACLIPLFPTIALFQGKPGTGKSTLLKIMRRLVSEENISTTDPSNFQGFGMENMIGKLLNVVLDIELSKPMSDAMVKQIIDRVPVEINRKYQRAAFSFLPAIHAFGANKLPRTLDGESKAYERRMCILRTESFQPSGEYDRDFDLWLWEQGPGGIVCAAVEGLFDLLEHKGHYHKLESGAVLVRQMQDRNDGIAQFLKALAEGDVRDDKYTLALHKDCKHPRTALWLAFSNWKKDEERFIQNIGRNQLLAGLEARGFTFFKTDGVWHVRGIGVMETKGANF